MRYILGIDQSTQGTKAALFDETGRVAAEGRRKHRQIITAEGYIEHDPAEIMTQTAAAVRDALESGGIAPGSVLAIGLCDQRVRNQKYQCRLLRQCDDRHGTHLRDGYFRHPFRFDLCDRYR